MRTLIFILTMVLFTPTAFALEPIGKVLAVKGDVQAVQKDGTVRAKLTLSSAVYENEKILTGQNSKVQVVFNDKSLFTVGENAEVILDKYAYDPQTGDGTSIIEVTRGIFKFLTGKIAKKDPEKVKVNTPFATIGVRGSGGIVHVEPMGQTTLNMTECCLNIAARGGQAAPVELKQVNTFSRVSENGTVTQPKPAPLSMLMQLNGAVSLEGAKKSTSAKVKAEPIAQKVAVKEKKKSLKELVKSRRVALVDAPADTEQKNAKAQQKPQDPKNIEGRTKPAVTRAGLPAGRTSLTEMFASEEAVDMMADDNGSLGGQLEESPHVVELVNTVNTAETEQGILSEETFGGDRITDLNSFGRVLSGDWKREHNSTLAVGGDMKVVIKDDIQSVIFERLDAQGQVIERRLFESPRRGVAKSVASPDFGPLFIYRGSHDNFVYGANMLGNDLTGDRYTFVTGNKGAVTASNQRVAGQRQYFNFIPDAFDNQTKFANFNLATGVNNPLKGSNFEGDRRHTNGGMVVDYTNNNNQFLGGHVSFATASDGQVYDYSFKFMAGKMETSGGSAIIASNATAYSFDNSSANGLVTQSGDVQTTDVYGAVNGHAVVDAYALTLGGDFQDDIYAVDAGIATPTGSEVNATDNVQTLKGYSSGYIVNTAGNAVMVGVNDAANATLSREDYSASGVTASASFLYSKVDANGEAIAGVADSLKVKFGGAGTNQAYISHNVYGAEEYQNDAGYSVGTNFGSFDGAANVETAMISSEFVDIPEISGLVETCQDCEHLTWGVWAGTVGVDGGDKLEAHVIPYVVGDNSKRRSWVALSPVVTASYKGVLVGAVSNGMQVQNNVGHFDANANFLTRTVNFDGNFADYHFTGSDTTADNIGFTELDLTTLEKGGNAVTGQATISGSFYGNNAENVGGSFNFNDQTHNVTGAGIYAGKKQ